MFRAFNLGNDFSVRNGNYFSVIVVAVAGTAYERISNLMAGYFDAM